MRERGIIFNAEMVRAVLEGRKTQTRRVCNEIDPSNFPGCLSKRQWARVNNAIPMAFGPDDFCPFGSVGDRMWVRETWSDVNHYGCSAVAYRADGEVRDLNEDDGEENDPNLEKYWFANWYPDLISGTEGRWTPSIHMPRWASRITLEITGVRLERLQDISESDAAAEGIEPLPLEPDMPQFYHEYFPIGIKNGLRCNMSAASSFSGLWEAIYGKESWQANPWVWVIEFKRVEGQ